MPQYVQKVGGQAIDLAATSYKSLQDAANAGFNPVSAPVQPVQPAPITTPAPQNAPVVTPTAPTNQLSIKDLANPANANLEADAIKRNGIWTNIENTVNPKNWNSLANDAFIDAVMRYQFGNRTIDGQNVYGMTPDEKQAYGKSEFGLRGATVGQVMDKLKLTSKLSNFGQWDQKEEKKIDATNQAETKKPKTMAETLDEMLNFDVSKVRTDAADVNDVPEKQTVVSTLKGELDTMKNEMDYNNILEGKAVADVKKKYYEEKDALGARVMSAAVSDRLLSKLGESTNRELDMQNIEQSIADATNVYKYNSKLIEYNIALGELQNAQQIVQQTATDALNMNTAKLNVLQFKDKLNQQDRDLMQKEIDREYQMAKDGYAYVQSPSALQELAKQKGLQWVKDNTINIAGKTYVKPAPTIKSTIQSVINGQVHTLGIDERGNVLKDFGAQDINKPTSKYQKIGTDSNGNDIMGWVDETNKTVTPVDLNSAVLPEGTIGGQCGDYIHSIMDNTPKFGDTWQSKQSAMNVSPDAFSNDPQVGDIVSFKTNLPYGHVAVVTAVDGGNVTLTESNYGLNEKVGNGRTISAKDKNILGAYRGASFKGQQEQTADSSEINDRLQNILPSQTIAGQKNAQAYIKQLLSKGDTKTADNYLNNLARQSLTGSLKEDYNIYGTTKSEASIALDTLEQFKSTNLSYYKNAVENLKPYAKLEKDQNWVKVTSQIQMTQAQLRRAMFGTAVTETEMQSAAGFLITDKDDIKTVETKLKGMAEFSDRARQRVLMEAQGISSDKLEVVAPDGKKYSFKNTTDARAFQNEIDQREKVQGNKYSSVSVIDPPQKTKKIIIK